MWVNLLGVSSLELFQLFSLFPDGVCCCPGGTEGPFSFSENYHLMRISLLWCVGHFLSDSALSGRTTSAQHSGGGMPRAACTLLFPRFILILFIFIQVLYIYRKSMTHTCPAWRTYIKWSQLWLLFHHFIYTTGLYRQQPPWCQV